MQQPLPVNRSLIKTNRAFTLAEVLVATVVATFLIGTVVVFSNAARQAYSGGISGENLQEGANIILAKIIEGGEEPGGVFRLSEATSYNLAGISELHFIGTDSVERFFCLNNASTAVIYHHPTGSGTMDQTIFTAPPGATITLRFSIPTGPQYTGVVVGIDVALIQNFAGRTLSGSASTYVTIRNHAV